jgi:hypothetical protein
MEKAQAAHHSDAVCRCSSFLHFADVIFSVLNTFRAMVMDEDIEKEDLYILDRMKEFLQNEKVSKIFAAKQLLSLVERAVSPESFV